MFRASACVCIRAPATVALPRFTIWLPVMGVSGPSRVNGTYHVAVAQKERVRRTRLLILVAGVFSLLGLLNVMLINNDMTGIEESGPQRLALAGVGIGLFVPSLLA